MVSCYMLCSMRCLWSNSHPCSLDYVTSMETCETRKRDGGNIIGAEVTTMETSKRRIDIYGIHDLLLMETR